MGMSGLRAEVVIFRRCSRSMQILLLANMVYAFVFPVLEIFVSAYVMRNSHDESRVFTYQLSLYSAMPPAFLVNGILLGRVAAKHLYAAGMVLSGVAMMMLMQSGVLTLAGIAAAGFAMGMATGLFWANRGFLALATTEDCNRNYYYGLELFIAMLASIVVPALVGWFISGASLYGWSGGTANRAYRVVAVGVFALTLLSAWMVERGAFRNPPQAPFLYFSFHPLWRRMLELSALKGVAQGYMLTVPPMLILLLVGQEGTLGVTQAAGGVLSAFVLYAVGRVAAPRHRRIVFASGLLLFLFGSLSSSLLFNEAGALIFVGCLMLAKPLLDLSYNPIEFAVVDCLARVEDRSEYAYLFNHELALFAGRFLGCTLFLVIAHWVSGVDALKYALPVVALLQLLSIPVSNQISRALIAIGASPQPGVAPVIFES
jgi:MFS transporter, YQGE family, putative transporter